MNEGMPGRKKGTANYDAPQVRSERFEMRCTPAFKQVLEELRKNGWNCKGYSAPDIVHSAIKSLAKTDFPDGDTKKLQDLISQI